MSKKPRIIFVFTTERSATSTRYGGFVQRLQKAQGFPDCDTLTVALENLVYVLDEQGGALVYDAVSGVDMADASFVYFKAWESMPENACALALYLSHKGVPFADTLPLQVGVSKLATMFRMWGSGLNVPFTIYSHKAEHVLTAAEKYQHELGSTYIVKDVFGEKGKRNFHLAHDKVGKTLEEYSTTHFMLQRYIQNDGDYRIGIYGYAARFAIKRVGSGNTHLNNVSAGGTATNIAIDALPPAVVLLAEQASAAASLQISGTDIIVDAVTQRPFVLEVNQGGQVVTGAFVDVNKQAFNEGLQDLLSQRYDRPHNQPLRIIGRRTTASLPELHINSIAAKIDTGAYHSTLHATNIRTELSAVGAKELVFDITANELLQSSALTRTFRVADYEETAVKSSNGHLEQRYAIWTQLSLAGLTFTALVTLSDRSTMKNPLLVGRSALRSRFMVNVELSNE